MGKLIKQQIDFLEESIKKCTDKGDSASWGMQEGILITKNDAKFFLKSLKEFSKLKSELKQNYKKNIEGFADWILKQNEANNLKIDEHDNVFILWQNETPYGNGKRLTAKKITEKYLNKEI